MLRKNPGIYSKYHGAEAFNPAGAGLRIIGAESRLTLAINGCYGAVRSIRTEFIERLSNLRWFAVAPVDGNVPTNNAPNSTSMTRTQMVLRHRRRSPNLTALQLSEVDVTKLVTDVVDLVNDAVRLHGVQIDRTLDPDSHTVYGDARQLGEMLVALLLHAVTLTLSARPDRRGIRITTMGTPNTVDICVDTQWPESFGVGLGMPLVRRIVEAHSGSISEHDFGHDGFSIEITLPKLWRKPNGIRVGHAIR